MEHCEGHQQQEEKIAHLSDITKNRLSLQNLWKGKTSYLRNGQVTTYSNIKCAAGIPVTYLCV